MPEAVLSPYIAGSLSGDVEGPKEQQKQGLAAEFDMIRLRRIDSIQPDGTIKQPQGGTTERAGYPAKFRPL